MSQSPKRNEPPRVFVQVNAASAPTHAAWRAAEAKWKDDIMLRHDSPKTLQAYAGWMRKCRGCMANTDPADVTSAEAKRFLADLAVRQQGSAAAQHQAFNARLFLCRHVLKQALGDLSDTPRAKRSQHIPTVLSRQEVDWRLAELPEPYALVAMLMDGCGVRLSEAANQRLHNVNRDTGIRSVQCGKETGQRIAIGPRPHAQPRPRSSARPAIRLRPLHHPRPDGIELHILSTGQPLGPSSRSDSPHTALPIASRIADPVR